jgi:hypothetical protein
MYTHKEIIREGKKFSDEIKKKGALEVYESGEKAGVTSCDRMTRDLERLKINFNR